MIIFFVISIPLLLFAVVGIFLRGMDGVDKVSHETTIQDLPDTFYDIGSEDKIDIEKITRLLDLSVIRPRTKQIEVEMEKIVSELNEGEIRVVFDRLGSVA